MRWVAIGLRYSRLLRAGFAGCTPNAVPMAGRLVVDNCAQAGLAGSGVGFLVGRGAEANYQIVGITPHKGRAFLSFPPEA